jgi:hypothetical protein
MSPPPSVSQQSIKTNERTLREFVSSLVTSFLDASQSSRESAEMTIEDSKAEKEKVENKVFQAFPPLDHVKDLGIISDEEVNRIMPAEALGDLDKSLGRFMGVS